MISTSRRRRATSSPSCNFASGAPPWTPGSPTSTSRSRTSRSTEGTFDTRRRLVRALGPLAGRAGENVVTWDGRGEFGDRLPRGLYFVRAGFAGATLARKVVLE